MVTLEVVLVSMVGATIWAVGGWLKKIDTNNDGKPEIEAFDPRVFAKTLALGAIVGVGAGLTGMTYADLTLVPVFSVVTIYVDAGLKATGIYRALDELWQKINPSYVPPKFSGVTEDALPIPKPKKKAAPKKKKAEPAPGLLDPSTRP